MNFLKILLVLTLFSIIPGQLIRIPIGSDATLTISDLLVFISAPTALIYFLTFKKSLRLNTKIIVAATLFTICAFASNVLALTSFSPREVAISSLFLIRFLLYFSISIWVANIVEGEKIKNWISVFLTVATIFTLAGFAQFLILPDLTFLIAYGWDPHIKRLVSTFLDPNFSGGFLTLAFALSASLYLENTKKVYLGLCLIFFPGIVLTFSRSSYLALFTALLILGLLKSPKLFIGFMAVFLVFLVSISQVRTRIAGAFAFDDTSQARLESWEKAIVIFGKNPLFGVGFNTYRYAQKDQGFFSIDDPYGGHSGGGVDSSILLVAATTGVVGLSAFLLFIYFLLAKFQILAKSNPVHLGALAGLVALLVHSQFVNSLFFPQIAIALWFTVGLVLANDN